MVVLLIPATARADLDLGRLYDFDNISVGVGLPFEFDVHAMNADELFSVGAGVTLGTSRLMLHFLELRVALPFVAVTTGLGVGLHNRTGLLEGGHVPTYHGFISSTTVELGMTSKFTLYAEFRYTLLALESGGGLDRWGAAIGLRAYMSL